jgi:hypothetical protein
LLPSDGARQQRLCLLDALRMLRFNVMALARRSAQARSSVSGISSRWTMASAAIGALLQRYQPSGCARCGLCGLNFATHCVPCRPLGHRTVWGEVCLSSVLRYLRRYIASGLLPGRQYRFRLKASNAVGASAWSATVRSLLRWLPHALRSFLVQSDRPRRKPTDCARRSLLTPQHRARARQAGLDYRAKRSPTRC